MRSGDKKMDIALFLASGTVGAVVFTELLKGIFEKWVTPRFQPIVVQALLLGICIVIAGLGAAWSMLPSNVAVFVATLFASSMATYEVLRGLILGKKP